VDVSDEQLSNQTHSRRDFLIRTATIAGGAASATPFIADRVSAAVRRRDRTVASTKTVQMWSQAYGDPKAFNDFISKTTAAFKKKTGITVKWDVIQWASALQKWDLAMSKGEVPDVADMFFLQSRVVQGRNKWGPLDITKDVRAGKFGAWSRYVPVAQLEAQYKRRIYGIPWRIDIRSFVYRSDLWGGSPPKTLGQFEQTSKKVLGQGKVSTAARTFGFGYQSLKAIGAIWGVQPLKADLQSSALLDPRWNAALTWAQKMVDANILLKEAVTDMQLPPYDSLLNGTVAAYLGTQAGILAVAQGTAPQTIPKIKSARMPAGPSGKSRGIASTAQFSIFQSTKARDESMQWLRYLTSPTVALALGKVSGQDSSDTVVQNRTVDAFHRPFYIQSRTAVGIDQPTPAWGELVATPEGPLTKLAVNVFSGNDVKNELASADKAVNAILAKYK
jgi:ABC-type glycerol-3-phosphate transport system substrate-binding protein